MSEPGDPGPGTRPPGARTAAAGDDPAASEPAIPLDTDDTRGLHLRQLARTPWLLSLSSTLAIVAFIIGGTQGGAAVGLLAAVAVVVITAVVVFAVASSRAKEDFFVSYAAQRGLKRRAKGGLPATTPLLRKGDKRYAEQIMNGTLPGGLAGAIALYTYEVESTDGDGNSDTDYHRFTVVMHELPEVAYKVSDVLCQRRSGFRWLDSAEDAFRRMQRLELESEALDKRYEIFFGPNDDELWLKQLFSPSFIIWLAHAAPSDFAFEFSAGGLCVNIEGHHDSAAELDELCEAAALVARRLAEEAGE